MNLFDGCNAQHLENDLAWLNTPQRWSFDEQWLQVEPPKGTDFFRPFGREARDSACLLYRAVSGDFTAATRVSLIPKGFGDAAAVTVRAGEKLWAKLCLERSPIGELNAVSVVTNPWSDDSNGELVKEPECWLRLTRKGNLFGMHYSLNGSQWRFVRAFGLEMPQEVLVGVHAQAPFEAGCEALFYSFDLLDHGIEDFRSGE
jgi:regulation of enolase protein 1 (concanavalin A-like superfamily)